MHGSVGVDDVADCRARCRGTAARSRSWRGRRQDPRCSPVAGRACRSRRSSAVCGLDAVKECGLPDLALLAKARHLGAARDVGEHLPVGIDVPQQSDLWAPQVERLVRRPDRRLRENDPRPLARRVQELRARDERDSPAGSRTSSRRRPRRFCALSIELESSVPFAASGEIAELLGCRCCR